MRHFNPELTASALRSALSIVNDELADCKRVLADSAEDECEWSERLMDELAELRIARRVLKRLQHEAHMDALEAAEYEEMARDREREPRSYRRDLEELDELLGLMEPAILTGPIEEERDALDEIAADLRYLMEQEF